MKKAFLIIAFFALWKPFPSFAKPVISEVMWMGSDRSTADEWLEIAGTSCDSADAACLQSPDHRTSISEWSVTYLDSKGVEKVMVRFATGATIGSGQYLVIANWHADQSRLEKEAFMTSTAVSIPNTKLLLRIRNASGAIMDEVDDGVGAPFAGDNPSGSGSKASMERISMFGEGADKANWRSATASRGFDSGPAIFGTPGFSADSGDLFVPPLPPLPVPVEATLLRGYVGSGSLLIGWKPSTTEDLSAQKVTIIVGDQLLFSQMLPATQSTLVLPLIISAPPDSYRVLLQSLGSAGGASEGITVLAQSLPPVFISEVLADPVGTDTQREWIEIANTSTGSIDLSGWTLTVSRSSKMYAFDSISLPPQSFVSFRRAQTGLILSNSGATLSLFDATGLPIDTFSYSGIAPGVSAGRLSWTAYPQPLCKPTESIANTSDDIDPQIVVQSGKTEDYEKVTLNLALTSESDSLKSAVCHWKFSDGFTSTSCNPPSHTIRNVGLHTIKVEVQTYCGTTIERTLTVTVLPSGGGAVRRVVPALKTKKEIVTSPTCQPTTFTGVTITELKAIQTGKQASDGWIELSNTTEIPVQLCGWKLQTQTGSSMLLDDLIVAPKSYAVVPVATKSKQLRSESGAIILFAPHPFSSPGNLEWRASSGALSVQAQSIRYKKAKPNMSFAWSKAYRGFYWTPVMTPGTKNDEYVLSVPPADFEGDNGLLKAEVKVLSVISGDTLDVALPTGMKIQGMSRIRVRLIGIDAPEMYNPSELIHLYARRAYKFLLALIDNKNIVLKIDTKKIDGAGKTLAYAQLLDGTSVHEKLLSEGMAYTYRPFPFADQDIYQLAQSKAKAQGKGIWSNTMLVSYFSDLENKNTYAGISPVINSTLLAYGRADVSISEVYSSPLKESPDCEWCIKEWIELENTSDEAIDTTGWMLQMNAGKPKAISLEVIEPHDFALIDITEMKMHLANKGGTAQLLDSEKNIVAKAVFESSKAGQSIFYISSTNRAESDNNASRVCVSDLPTPGTKNICRQKTKPAKVATVKKKAAPKAKKAVKVTKKKAAAKEFVKNELSEVEKLAKVGFINTAQSNLWATNTLIILSGMLIVVLSVFVIWIVKRWKN
ncbi:MAG: lamin tail domain-containing protein [Candidatus Peribacteraceae bacterium]|nr:lamin tail domain-containing protein [Candidatus Peribacteraceae bacterium]